MSLPMLTKSVLARPSARDSRMPVAVAEDFQSSFSSDMDSASGVSRRSVEHTRPAHRVARSRIRSLPNWHHPSTALADVGKSIPAGFHLTRGKLLPLFPLRTKEPVVAPVVAPAKISHAALCLPVPHIHAPQTLFHRCFPAHHATLCRVVPHPAKLCRKHPFLYVVQEVASSNLAGPIFCRGICQNPAAAKAARRFCFPSLHVLPFPVLLASYVNVPFLPGFVASPALTAWFFPISAAGLWRKVATAPHP